MLRNLLFISLEIVGAYENILIGNGITFQNSTKQKYSSKKDADAVMLL